jgi:hypothetical protein
MLVELALAVLLKVKTALLLHYLTTKKSELALSTVEIDEIMVKHKIVSYVLLGLFAMEMLRLLTSRGLRSIVIFEREKYEQISQEMKVVTERQKFSQVLKKPRNFADASSIDNNSWYQNGGEDSGDESDQI